MVRGRFEAIDADEGAGRLRSFIRCGLARIDRQAVMKSPGVALLISATLVGCARYEPLPLTSESVERALALPTRGELQTRIASLNNPLVRAADFDPDGAMTPGGAAVLAVLNNPSVRAQHARVNVAEAHLLQASILPNPSLSFGLDAPIGRRSGGEVPGYGLGIAWEFTALIARGAKVKAATEAAQQVRLDVAWNEWRVAQAARLAAFTVVALREQRSDTERLHGQLQRIADQMDHALAQHDVTAANAAAARAAEQDARVSLAGIDRDVRDAELALNRAMGVPPSTPIRLADDVALPAARSVPDVDVFIKNLENRRIDLVALRRGYDSQESTVRAAILGQFPRIALGITNTRDFGNFLTLGPTVTADLPFFDRNQGNIAIESATRQQLYDEYITRVFEARSDVARAVQLIRSLNEVISVQSGQVQSLRNLLSSYEAALSAGNLDVGTFCTAAVSLAQKQSDLTTLKKDLTSAWINLELASGASLDNKTGDDASNGESH